MESKKKKKQNNRVYCLIPFLEMSKIKEIHAKTILLKQKE